MPGPAAHLSIIELQSARAAGDPQRYGAVGSALAAHPREAGFGSIGPDMLFWADWNTYTPLVNAVFDVYHKLDLIYDKLAALWEPIGRAIDKVVDALTGGLAGAVNDTVAYVSGIINTAMLELITRQLDYWQTLKPHFQTYAPRDPENNWNWLDYTHHRATGRFAKRLIARAHDSGDAGQRAYAYGWLSHVTADVVGHAYVNQAVGGPWRTDFQRHHLQENFMDAWTWGFYHTPGVAMPTAPPAGASGASGASGAAPPFDYAAFNGVNEANLHERIDLGDDLPDSLQSLIADTLSDVYKPIPHPTVLSSFLGKSEINRAYQMQKEALEIISGKDRRLGPPKVPQVFGDLDAPDFPSAGGSGGGGGGGGGGGFSLSSILSAIWDFIKGTLAYIADLGLWLLSKITSPLTYGLRYGLYLIQLGLYQVYRAFRWALVVSAYVYPDADELSDPLAQQFINPAPTLLLNTPRLAYPLERDHSLYYPLSTVEEQSAVTGPYGHAGLNFPYWFIEGEPTDPDLEKALAHAETPAETIALTSVLKQNLRGPKTYRGSLGSAVDLYLRRAAELHEAGGDPKGLQLPDWNIDADRGYGFKCWQADSTLDPQPATGVDVEYL